MCGLWLLAACTDPKQELITTEKAAVMAIHDEAMPRMDEMAQLKRQLRKMQTLALADSTVAAKNSLTKIDAAIHQLEAGEKAMFDFMANYKVPQPDMHSDSALAYLEIKKTEANQMRQLMFSAIDEAQQTLSALEIQ